MNTPESLVNNLYKKISKFDRFVFLFSFVACFLIHLYTYTNILSSHDSTAIFNDSTGFANGRFMVFVFNLLLQKINVPIIIGVITSAFMGLAVTFVCKTFNIKNYFFSIILSVLMISHPTIVASHYYFTSAHIYSFSLLAAVLSAYVIDKHKIGGPILSVFLLILSLGSYQAYIDLFLGILILKLIVDCENNEINLIKIIGKGVKFVITTIITLCIYLVIWKIVPIITNTEVVNYRNYTDLESTVTNGLFSNICTAFNIGIDLFFSNKFNHTGIILFLFYILYFATIITTICIAIKNRSKSILLIPILFCFLVFSSAFIYVLSPGDLHALMIFASICPIILLVKNLDTINKRPPLNLLSTVLSWVVTISLVVVSFNQVVSANVFYTKMAINYNHSLSYCTKLVDRIEQTDGFTKETEIVLVGRGYSIATYDSLDFWPNHINSYMYSSTGLTYKETVVWFIKQNMNTNMNLSCDTGKYAKQKDVQNLEVFPEKNCMLWDDDKLIVKIDYVF